MERGKTTDCIYLDFCEAFATLLILHNILAAKLGKYEFDV